MQRLGIVFLSLILSGCGLSFSNIPNFNKGLPEDFKRRVLWAETDIFKYNLEQLAGHVIYAKAAVGQYDRGPRYVKPQKAPVLKVIDSGQIYHSKIDRGAQAEGSYLAFAAALSDDQTADVNIIDTAQVFIPYEDVPMEDLLKEAAKPAPSGTTKRYYIQGVLLATVTTQYGVKIKADASGVVGNAFGAKGNVYNEEMTVGRDFRISLLLIDIDKLKQASSRKEMAGASAPLLLRESQADGFKVQKINGLEGALVPPLPR